MRASRKVFAVLGLAVATVCVGSATADDRRHKEEVVRARLIGINEVPSVSTVARGRFKAVIDEEAGTINFTLSYSALEANPTQAHIHVGQTHTNGGITLFLCTNLTPPAGVPVPQACPAGPTEISGTLTQADVLAVVAQGIDANGFAEVLRAIRAGATYANVHSERFGSGEIRGPITRD
ncbi:MAG TPA: CHRD domain-containing protein [Steroidobacteraceae bacterium]|nr:CHRD domain-containing protein [Steroidobacteraceae bacterium]